MSKVAEVCENAYCMFATVTDASLETGIFTVVLGCRTIVTSTAGRNPEVNVLLPLPSS